MGSKVSDNVISLRLVLFENKPFRMKPAPYFRKINIIF
jgi:hypothetical protein